MTSNAEKATFNFIKRRLSLQKQPLLTVIHYFINYSISWLINSTKIKIEIPLFYEKRVNPLIGKTALDYIIEKQTELLTIKTYEKCEFKTVTNGLLCCQYFCKNFSTFINIPEEYWINECNYFIKEKQKLTKNDCRISVENMEEVELNLDEVVIELKNEMILCM